LIDGHAPGGKKLLGTFTGSWSKDAGFTSLSIGSSSSPDVLVVTTGHCKKGKR
jgi:hypothetical protein